VAQVFGTLNPVWGVIDKDTWAATMLRADTSVLHVSLRAVTLPREPVPLTMHLHVWCDVWGGTPASLTRVARRAVGRQGQQEVVAGEREEEVAQQAFDLRHDVQLLGYQLPAPLGGQFPPNSMVLMLSNGFYATPSLRALLQHDHVPSGGVSLRQPLRESPLTVRARWVTLRARWVTLRARWVTLRARWVTLRARWVTLRARWVTLRACWVTLRARWV
jgi:hypothetical protein